MVTRTSDPSEFWDRMALLEMDEQVELFRDYLQVMEESLEAKAQEYRERGAHLRQERYARLKQEGRQFDPTEPLPPGEAGASYQGQMVETIFASILRESFCVSLYAFLESRLVEECRYREQWGKARLPLADVISGGIDTAKECLKGQVDFSGQEWQAIRKFQRLRNFIVHCGNSFENTRSEHNERCLKDDVAHEPFLSLGNKGIIFHKGFCEKAIDLVETLLELL